MVGVELSPIAVRAFFKNNRMQPARRKQGKFTLWQCGRIDILCGDLFDLTAADLGDVAAIFDRASLTALPEYIRHAYLAHLRKIVPAACKILLLTTEEPEADETQHQPFAIADEISSLYARDLLHRPQPCRKSVRGRRRPAHQGTGAHRTQGLRDDAEIAILRKYGTKKQKAISWARLRQTQDSQLQHSPYSHTNREHPFIDPESG